MTIATFFRGFFTGRDRAPSELELSDMGLSRADFRRLSTSKAGTRDRMEALAAQYGVTPALIDADRGLALELAQTCGHCQCAKACQNALDLGVDFDAGRCPNATVYADMSPA
ncbi:hypothetical protein Z946_80 [Sulfitobacter noctilucicola]|uniref:Uncharacterized protein n=1 Tax=Sulfitobacter noctilucicola TaxID=1342301 RepID=A0A7W6MC20_9RHOB|nr:hypothetical protein [Sulfitobacter noctilucicola]KIN70226.1 hypothetical protein Z946_80 [Sulfitobacter noctilucicola]MBB4176129.1 hypothetical protein [Sulfitobacter noctilucicola]